MEEAPLPSAQPTPAASGYHTPVLLAEVLEYLRPSPGKTILDGTLGGGGHTEAFLQAGSHVIGVDQDPEAIAHATARLAQYGSRFTVVRGNFAEVEPALDELEATGLHAVLLDLGVSSRQLDEAARGFSFQAEGPLDMRMNPTARLTAADLVNGLDAEELAKILRTLGEEPAAWRIAQRLVQDRLAHPFQTTLELAQAVERVVPRRGRTHPATRVFQALRLAVNRELEVLEIALTSLSRRLAPGGRMGVITFHSLEDRIVKQFFATHSAPEIDHPTWPAPRPNPNRWFQKVTGKAVAATAEEQKRNPRSRSAKLRVVERLFNT